MNEEHKTIPKRPPRWVNADPETELDHLNGCLSVLEPNGIDYEDPYSVPDRNKERGGDRPKVTSLTPGAETMCLHAQHRPVNPPLETHAEPLFRAMRTLRRIETLMATEQSCRAAIVLLVAYLVLGSETRALWRKREEGLEGFVGMVCAGRKDRVAWLTMEPAKLGAAGARAYGTGLLKTAHAAWGAQSEADERGVPNRGRVRLSEVRSRLETIVAETWSDVRAVEQLRENAAREAAKEAAELQEAA